MTQRLQVTSKELEPITPVRIDVIYLCSRSIEAKH